MATTQQQSRHPAEVLSWIRSSNSVAILDIACFTRCCRNIDILLTPYDVIRMKNRLGITSTEFLAEVHTLSKSMTRRLIRWYS